MKRTENYWELVFEGNENIPERVKRAIKRIYNAYPEDCTPNGICDPLYIMNVICFELGIGDGKGNFNLPGSVEKAAPDEMNTRKKVLRILEKMEEIRESLFDPESDHIIRIGQAQIANYNETFRNRASWVAALKEREGIA